MLLKNLFVVEDRRPGVSNLVFLHTDPRKYGYAGRLVAEGAELDYDWEGIAQWPDGAPAPDPQLGRHPTDPTRFRVFKSPADLRRERYDLVRDGVPDVDFSWKDYWRRFPPPTDQADRLDPDEWVSYLEAIDAATKARLARREHDPEPPAEASTEQVARWVARQHLATDPNLRRVIYLPAGAQPDEVRLVEVGVSYAGGDDPTDPFNYPIRLAGRKATVRVLDVTEEQLGLLRDGRVPPPAGWDFAGSVEVANWRERM